MPYDKSRFLREPRLVWHRREVLPDALRPLLPVHHANRDTAEIAFARCDGNDDPALDLRRLAAFSRPLRTVVTGDDPAGRLVGHGGG